MLSQIVSAGVFWQDGCKHVGNDDLVGCGNGGILLWNGPVPERVSAELKKQQQSAAVPRRIEGPAFGTEILLPLLVLGRIVAELE